MHVVTSALLALQAEQMWEKFHAWRISTKFRGEWDEIFCKATDKRAPASVFQYITTRWFRAKKTLKWGMLTAHYGEDVPTAVLKKISELYLTVRGFSFSSSCLELYKQINKSQLQKSKGLRRKLQTTQPTTIDK